MTSVLGSLTRAFTPSLHGFTGVLRHEDTIPLTDQRVQICVKRLGGLWTQVVGETATDALGNFNFTAVSLPGNTTRVFLRVFEEGLQTNGRRPKEHLVYEKALDFDRDQINHQLRDVTVDVYEYDETTGLPLFRCPTDKSRRPQQWGAYELFHLAFPNIREQVISLWLKLKGKVSTVTTEEVQRRLGVPGGPELTRANAIRMVLNGICNYSLLLGELGNERVVDIRWDGFEKDEVNPVLPNVKATFTIDDNQNLSFKSILVTFKDGSTKTYNDADADFNEGLLWFTSMGAVYGEVKSHLGTHLVVQQYALAAYSCLNRNPLANLLKPHMREVIEINRVGETAIFGPEGVLNVSGLTVTGIQQALRETLANHDYAGFQPPTPLNDQHTLAHGQQLYWNLCRDAVDEFFRENEESITSNWYEIYNMSERLVRHSVPYAPREGHAVEDFDPHFHPAIIQDSEARRDHPDGGKYTMTPITAGDSAPQPGDMERLKAMCQHALYLSTFFHAYIHSSQREWVTNVGFATLAPQEGGALPYLGTDPQAAMRQLAIAKGLTDFNRGHLVTNPNGDIQDCLLRRVIASQGEFERLGIDITSIYYGVII